MFLFYDRVLSSRPGWLISFLMTALPISAIREKAAIRQGPDKRRADLFLLALS